jgi:hypothetical protein
MVAAAGVGPALRLPGTTGTYAGAAGLNAFIVRDLLGHKTLAMTGRYVSRHADPLRAAADAVSGQIMRRSRCRERRKARRSARRIGCRGIVAKVEPPHPVR